MTTYRQRASDQSKTVLVNPLTYKSTLEIGHKFKPDTSVNQDMVRYTLSAAMQEHIDNCKSSCGDVRREVASFGFAMLLGQDAGYYERKRQMINDAITATNVLLTNWDDVILGIVPGFDSVVATVQPKEPAV